ncbi:MULTISPECIES: hypothetical protein [Microbacterium]|uniref:Uncharacterized protein n=2 Tax=Microbacterium TaxID=33882 RepID=A0A9W6HHY8_9MICO|nr:MULTISPECIES: hypothetical protein [Microbacterium]MBP2420823.1 hypothetical protein [Microbacterium imperiale]MDD7928081.1 hypothetical protein [Microbacterium thalli]MDD7963614.1 hypothetical protein [Microbacterium thalli]MDN8550044.1 hypothetical protein [Microbacterium thalli]MDS0200059.1 hypothetical protein [Microbacterium imperiale]
MKCPVDATDLLITERSGVEIDYRPHGRERDQHGRTSRRKREGFVGEFFGF